MDNSTIAVIFTGIGLLVMLAEKIFGSGGKLTSKFATLEKETTAEIHTLRMEFIEKSDRNNANSKVGFDAITANIHALQLGFSEFRATMAENYMRRDSFYKATDELKRDFSEKHNELKADVRQGFEETREQLDAMAQVIEANRKERKL